MTRDAMKRLGLVSLILLLHSAGVSTSPLWSQAATPGGPLETSAFFTTTDGVELHYLDAGRGRPIVFITGGTMTADYWEPQIREFSLDYRTIALDTRGHGRSEAGLAGEGYEWPRLAADIHELIETLDLSNVVLVGWSMGVRQVLNYVDRHGTDRIGGVVFVDGVVWFPQPWHAEVCANWTAVDAAHNVEQSDSAWADRLFQETRQMLVRVWPEESATRAAKARSRMLRTVFAWIGTVSFCGPGSDKRATLSKLDRASIPVLYIVSSPRYLADGQGDTLKNRIPKARVESWADVGTHTPFIDAPDRFNRVLRQFLRDF